MCFCLLDWKRLKTDVTPHLAAGLGGRSVRNGVAPCRGRGRVRPRIIAGILPTLPSPGLSVPEKSQSLRNLSASALGNGTGVCSARNACKLGSDQSVDTRLGSVHTSTTLETV